MRISDWSSDVCSSDLDEARSMRVYRWLHRRTAADPGPGCAAHCDKAGAVHDYFLLLAARPEVRPQAGRSEERRVGKECVSTCRSRWSPDHSTKNKYKT